MASLEINVNQVNSDFNGIKKAIIDTGVEVSDGTTTSEYADKVNEVYKKGRQSWWDDYQRDGATTMYAYAFYGSLWRDEIYEPNHPFTVNNGYGMFDSTYVTDTKQPISFVGSNVLTTNMFSSTKLVTIRSLIVNENNTFNSNMFSKATGLVNITFEGTIANNLTMGTCTKLSKASIQSIFNCLSATASGMTLTLSTTAVNNAFSGGSTGAEWENLIATKPNWKISLA